MARATRRSRRSVWNIAPYAHAWMNRVPSYFKTAKKFEGQTFGRTKRRGNVKSGQGITLQRDRAAIYRRKRAPRRVRYRAKRSFRSFKSKVLKMKGHRTLMTNRSVVIGGTGTADKQAITSFVLFGGRVDGVGSATSRGYDDMNDMRTRDYMMGDFTGDAERRWASGEIKWYVKTAVMDMTIQNTSELQFALEMDIYEFVCGEMPTAAGPDVESAIAYYQQDVYNVGSLGAAVTTLEQTDRGATPFEFGVPMSKFKMKILKKTKYFIPYGDVVTYQIRQSKIRTLGHSVYRNNSPTTRYTHGVYIVSKPVPAEASQEHQYTVGCTRKYKYVVDEGAATRSNEWNPVG